MGPPKCSDPGAEAAFAEVDQAGGVQDRLLVDQGEAGPQIIANPTVTPAVIDTGPGW